MANANEQANRGDEPRRGPDAALGECDRPPKNRRHISDTDMAWDTEAEDALLRTVGTPRAVTMTLCRFHSTPAKGRLWKKGYRLHHAHLHDGGVCYVAAWLDAPSGDAELAPPRTDD